MAYFRVAPNAQMFLTDTLWRKSDTFKWSRGKVNNLTGMCGGSECKYQSMSHRWAQRQNSSRTFSAGKKKGKWGEREAEWVGGKRLGRMLAECKQHKQSPIKSINALALSDSVTVGCIFSTLFGAGQSVCLVSHSDQKVHLCATQFSYCTPLHSQHLFGSFHLPVWCLFLLASSRREIAHLCCWVIRGNRCYTNGFGQCTSR